VSFIPDIPFCAGDQFEMQLTPELIYNSTGHMHSDEREGVRCECEDECGMIRERSFRAKQFAIPDADVINLRVRLIAQHADRDTVVSFMRSTSDLFRELIELARVVVPLGFDVKNLFCIMCLGQVEIRTAMDAANLVHLSVIGVNVRPN
jgi:hypothetical protein